MTGSSTVPAASPTPALFELRNASSVWTVTNCVTFSIGCTMFTFFGVAAFSAAAPRSTTNATAAPLSTLRR
uniref:Uncharacterized protein n=1 Tax=Romanomermis culicivorax TaxID=13658 RepID=A0A915KJE9_ROMCU